MSRVLVVDDDADTRQLVRELLEEEGHEVEDAATAAEAVRRLHQRLPELVLVDLKLPDDSDLAVVQAVRQRGGRVRVVVTTASTRPDVPDGVPVLAKPFDLDALVEVARGKC